MNEENKLDDIFRKKLKNPVSDAEYREDDWSRLEQLLDKKEKKKAFVYWLPVLSGVAAMLFLLAGWWFFRPATRVHPPHSAQLVKSGDIGNSGANGGPGRQQSYPNQIARQTGRHPEQLTTKNQGAAFRASLSPSAPAGRRAAGFTAGIVPDTVNTRIDNGVLDIAQSGFANSAAAVSGVVPVQYKTFKQVAVTGNSRPVITKGALRPQYTLSFVAAPDVNGVGGLQNGRVGTNAGMIFSARFADRIAVSSGLMYSSKPYLTSFQGYHTSYQFNQKPSSVLADCRMLDIPINIGYDIYRRHRNTFSVGTGISSYIMLHQNYTFQYAGQYPAGPSSYNVPGVSKYYFGILNLNASYTRQMNSAVSFTVQPYLKLPLANVGYSQVRLQTAGVAVSINWNLNSSSKP